MDEDLDLDYLQLAFKPSGVPLWRTVVRCYLSHEGKMITKHIFLIAYMGKDISTTIRAVLRNARRIIREKKLFRRYGIWSAKQIKSLQMEIIDPECLACQRTSA